MSRPKVGVVIPVGAGRHENLAMCLGTLVEQTVKPDVICLVFDGPNAAVKLDHDIGIPVAYVQRPKHEPGMEQPRNVGVRVLDQTGSIDYVWFVDTDIIFTPSALQEFHSALLLNPEKRILCGPYDWLPPGFRAPMPQLENDPRWARFKEAHPFTKYEGDLSAGLACFSGNLIWPIEEFKRVGGFWNEIHHGRCEDGELGLRATAMGVPIPFVAGARGWHLFHPINEAWVRETNARDVPMLNARHPWQELGEGGEELFVVEEDGKRFNWRCPKCGAEMNSALIWAHQSEGCG